MEFLSALKLGEWSFLGCRDCPKTTIRIPNIAKKIQENPDRGLQNVTNGIRDPIECFYQDGRTHFPNYPLQAIPVLLLYSVELHTISCPTPTLESVQNS
jgi:hypothetical protein